MDIILYLIVGGVAGWLAGQVSKGSGFGIIGNVLLGIVGGIVGGFLFGLLGLKAVGLMGSLVTSAVGAWLVLWLARYLKTGR